MSRFVRASKYRQEKLRIHWGQATDLCPQACFWPSREEGTQSRERQGLGQRLGYEFGCCVGRMFYHPSSYVSVPHLPPPELHQLELERLRGRSVRDLASPKPIPPYCRTFPTEATGYSSIGPESHCYCPRHYVVALQRFHCCIRW